MTALRAVLSLIWLTVVVAILGAWAHLLVIAALLGWHLLK